MSGAGTWDACLGACVQVFTQPSFVLFRTLISAWVLCPGRRTVTRMIGIKIVNATWSGYGHDLAKNCWASVATDSAIPQLKR